MFRVSNRSYFSYTFCGVCTCLANEIRLETLKKTGCKIIFFSCIRIFEVSDLLFAFPYF